MAISYWYDKIILVNSDGSPIGGPLSDPVLRCHTGNANQSDRCNARPTGNASSPSGICGVEEGWASQEQELITYPSLPSCVGGRADPYRTSAGNFGIEKSRGFGMVNFLPGLKVSPRRSVH
jgi:hypothetical protein